MGLGEGEGMTSILPFLFELYYQERKKGQYGRLLSDFIFGHLLVFEGLCSIGSRDTDLVQ